jgi:hypothetical protein
VSILPMLNLGAVCFLVDFALTSEVAQEVQLIPRPRKYAHSNPSAGGDITIDGCKQGKKRVILDARYTS